MEFLQGLKTALEMGLTKDEYKKSWETEQEKTRLMLQNQRQELSHSTTEQQDPHPEEQCLMSKKETTSCKHLQQLYHEIAGIKQELQKVHQMFMKNAEAEGTKNKPQFEQAVTATELHHEIQKLEHHISSAFENHDRSLRIFVAHEIKSLKTSLEDKLNFSETSSDVVDDIGNDEPEADSQAVGLDDPREAISNPHSSYHSGEQSNIETLMKNNKSQESNDPDESITETDHRGIGTNQESQEEEQKPQNAEKGLNTADETDKPPQESRHLVESDLKDEGRQSEKEPLEEGSSDSSLASDISTDSDSDSHVTDSKNLGEAPFDSEDDNKSEENIPIKKVGQQHAMINIASEESLNSDFSAPALATRGLREYHDQWQEEGKLLKEEDGVNMVGISTKANEESTEPAADSQEIVPKTAGAPQDCHKEKDEAPQKQELAKKEIDVTNKKINNRVDSCARGQTANEESQDEELRIFEDSQQVEEDPVEKELRSENVYSYTCSQTMEQGCREPTQKQKEKLQKEDLDVDAVDLNKEAADESTDSDTSNHLMDEERPDNVRQKEDTHFKEDMFGDVADMNVLASDDSIDSHTSIEKEDEGGPDKKMLGVLDSQQPDKEPQREHLSLDCVDVNDETCEESRDLGLEKKPESLRKEQLVLQDDQQSENNFQIEYPSQDFPDAINKAPGESNDTGLSSPGNDTCGLKLDHIRHHEEGKLLEDETGLNTADLSRKTTEESTDTHADTQEIGPQPTKTHKASPKEKEVLHKEEISVEMIDLSHHIFSEKKYSDAISQNASEYSPDEELLTFQSHQQLDTDAANDELSSECVDSYHTASEDGTDSEASSPTMESLAWLFSSEDGQLNEQQFLAENVSRAFIDLNDMATQENRASDSYPQEIEQGETNTEQQVEILRKEGSLLKRADLNKESSDESSDLGTDNEATDAESSDDRMSDFIGNDKSGHQQDDTGTDFVYVYLKTSEESSNIESAKTSETLRPKNLQDDQQTENDFQIEYLSQDFVAVNTKAAQERFKSDDRVPATDTRSLGVGNEVLQSEEPLEKDEMGMKNTDMEEKPLQERTESHEHIQGNDTLPPSDTLGSFHQEERFQIDDMAVDVPSIYNEPVKENVEAEISTVDEGSPEASNSKLSMEDSQKGDFSFEFVDMNNKTSKESIEAGIHEIISESSREVLLEPQEDQKTEEKIQEKDKRCDVAVLSNKVPREIIQSGSGIELMDLDRPWAVQEGHKQEESPHKKDIVFSSTVVNATTSQEINDSLTRDQQDDQQPHKEHRRKIMGLEFRDVGGKDHQTITDIGTESQETGSGNSQQDPVACLDENKPSQDSPVPESNAQDQDENKKKQEKLHSKDLFFPKTHSNPNENNGAKEIDDSTDDDNFFQHFFDPDIENEPSSKMSMASPALTKTTTSFAFSDPTKVSRSSSERLNHTTTLHESSDFSEQKETRGLGNEIGCFWSSHKKPENQEWQSTPHETKKVAEDYSPEFSSQVITKPASVVNTESTEDSNSSSGSEPEDVSTERPSVAPPHSSVYKTKESGVSNCLENATNSSQEETEKKIDLGDTMENDEPIISENQNDTQQFEITDVKSMLYPSGPCFTRYFYTHGKPHKARLRLSFNSRGGLDVRLLLSEGKFGRFSKWPLILKGRVSIFNLSSDRYTTLCEISDLECAKPKDGQEVGLDLCVVLRTCRHVYRDVTYSTLDSKGYVSHNGMSFKCDIETNE